MPDLKGSQRRFLKAQAHHLSPLVFVGKKGLTDELVAATDEALEAHELIKIKFNDCKDEKRAIVATLVERTHSEEIGIIGNIAIVYRQQEAEEKRRIELPEA